MIYLTTGANGAGKTLFTLKDVREQQLRENRPVYFNGFDMDPVKQAEFGWDKFNPREWQDLPDGSICIMDECQNEMPKMGPSQAVPEWINAIAQFRRKRGFDFWLITPHPSLIHVNVRRLIESPSWHRHMKRTFGGDLVSELKFNAPNLQCEKPGAGADAITTMRAFPKEVYTWYRSASLHTGKRKMPKAIYAIAVVALAVPLLFWYVFGNLSSRVKGDAIGSKRPAASAPAAAAPVVGVPPVRSAQVAQAAPAGVSTSDYIAMHRERVEGLPYTAPRYDGVTTPVEAPYPAACVVMGKRCDCFTQQATKLQTPADVCRQIAANGFFIPWARPVHASTPVPAPSPSVAPVQGLPAPVPAVASAIAPEPEPDGRSTLGRALPRVVNPPAVVSGAHDGTVIGAMKSGRRVF